MLFLIPLLVFQVLVYAIPIGSTICSAFTNTVGPTAGQFTMTGNFKRVADDLLPIILRTLVWTFGSILPAMVIGLGAAYFFRRKFFGQKLCISICLIPYTIPLIIVAACWYFMFQPNFGLLNTIFQKLNITQESFQFFTKDRAMISVIIARIWRSMPFAFLSFYAAIREIPQEHYEAASIDGAGEWKQFLYITLPQLRPVALSTGIILTVWTFLVFDIISALTGGGPGTTTTILPIAIYREMFAMHDAGAASALSLISITIMSILTVLYWRFMERENT
ncbi:MAG: sugar ABC transporter permease [Clostridia bacterium]